MQIQQLRGAGPRTVEQLKKLGVHSVEDLLLHLPSRYEDRTQLRPLNQLQGGHSQRFCGQVQQLRPLGGRRPGLQAKLADNQGELSVVWFSRRGPQEKLAVGDWLLCWGDVREGRFGLECAHPQMTPVPSPQQLPDLGDRLSPIYPTTAGLTQGRINQLMQQALARVDSLFPQLIPQDVAPRLEVAQALRTLHAPPVDGSEDMLEARQRLAFEEWLAQRLAIARTRARMVTMQAPRCPPAPQAEQLLREQLPFSPTSAQEAVLEEIRPELAQAAPMLRLVQGDVGCGKTAVAALAAVAPLAAGFQVALMAPTDILARQHVQTLQPWFAALRKPVGLLTGSQTAAERKKLLQAVAQGDVAVVVGTHALFQDKVVFQQLGLVIVDEQHRFGVGQRLALRDKSGAVVAHQLIMTATPIPRTLAQTVFADLQISQITARPPGRQPIATVSLPQARRGEVIERLRVVCAEGRQAYWVCPALSESEHATAAEDIAELLREQLPELQIGLMHGQLKPAEKMQVMEDFRAHRAHVLVATTVIEVGVDVPGASIIVIDEAERLGLAQLHQLRGRVGRGEQASFCVLLHKTPLSDTARARLKALCDSDDGFVLAEKDLELRGPGELLGTAQSGDQRLRFADVMLDAQLLPQVMRVADTLEEHPSLAQALVQRWLGQRLDYAAV